MSVDFLDVFMLQKAREVATSASQSAVDAQRVSAGTRELVDRLELQVERLTLLTVALSELLTEQGTFTEDRLRAKVAEVDLRDGKADGRLTSPPLTCPTCSRVKSGTRPRCVWCGTDTAPTMLKTPPVR